MNHEEQRVAALRHSLKDAGIGREYHERSLKEVDDQLFAAASGPIVVNAKSGQGIIFLGTDRATDAAILTARALHLQGVGSKVVYLPQLVSWLHHNSDDLLAVETAQCLTILNWVQNGESPLTRWQQATVETLLQERLDEGRTFFAQATRTAEGTGWWSETFVDRITRVSTTWSLPSEHRSRAS